MKIFYFGELIEDTNAPKKAEVDQLVMSFAEGESDPQPKKTGMESIGDILKDLDLNIDIYHPMHFSN